jgi:hypothetical protein
MSEVVVKKKYTYPKKRNVSGTIANGFKCLHCEHYTGHASGVCLHCRKERGMSVKLIKAQEERVRLRR